MRLLLAALLLLPAAAQITPAPAGVETYYLVFLRRAPDRKPLSQAEGDRIQEAHMNNIRGMAARGVLVAAGPFEDTPPSISGIFVFSAPSLAEARRIAAQDPTVVEHRNNVEVYAWRGPAGLGAEYRRLHAADPKTPEGMGVHPLALLFGGAKEPSREIAEAHAAYVKRLRAEYHRWWCAAHVLP